MDKAFARRQMVRQQVRTCDVFDPEVLRVLDELSREDFVPTRFAHLAYADVEIPLAHNQRMMMPSLEGQLLQALEISADDRVLEIGTGSGFLTACLATLGASVTSLELFEDLAETATKALKHADIANAEVIVRDATRNLPEDTFDVVAVTGSTPELRAQFVERLAPGGRLFTVVGDAPIMQARLIKKDTSGEVADDTAVFEAMVSPLIGAQRDSLFAF
ncbi:MAG: protein-L-isoaspartate O-methyltransferase [Pseudomonadota bacterium]